MTSRYSLLETLALLHGHRHGAPLLRGEHADRMAWLRWYAEDGECQEELRGAAQYVMRQEGVREMSDEETAWEPIEKRRMWGVFDAIGYSADPIAMFRDKEEAEEWLRTDEAKGDDREVWCETCVLAVDVEGRCWNSVENAP